MGGAVTVWSAVAEACALSPTLDSMPNNEGAWANAISSLSLLLAAIVFLAGVGAWKRTYIGRRRIALAQILLARFYEVEDIIAEIRTPLSWEGEGRTRRRGEHESPQDSDRLDRAWIVIERYQRHQRFFAELRALRYRAIAMFGEGVVGSFDEVEAVIRAILQSSHMLGSYHWKRQGEGFIDRAEFDRHLRDKWECEAVIWKMSGDKDKISPRVSAAVRQIEGIARPEFQALDSIWRKLTRRLIRPGRNRESIEDG